MNSKGYWNFRFIALLLTLFAGIGFVKEYIFYGRDIEIMGASEVSVAPALQNGDTAVAFTLQNENGTLPCALSFCGEGGWRLQSEYEGKISDYGASQLLSYYLEEENHCVAQAVTVTQKDGVTVVTAPDGSSAEISSSPFGIVYKSPQGNVSAEVTGLAVNNGNTVVRGKLKSQEAMWGSGQHFDRVNQRGEHIEINAIDEWALIKRNSYLPIPILVSSRGSGLFMNRFERMTIDVDSRIVPKDTWQFCVLDAPCDLFVYTTENPADVLYGYSSLTGFSPEPAEWTYGTAVCRYYPDFSTVQGVKDMAAAMEAEDMPWEAVIVEGFNASDKAALKEMSETVHAMGKKLMVYTATGMNPFWHDRDETALMVTNAATGSYNLIPANSDNPEDNPDVGTWQYLDITNAELREYLFGNVWATAVNEYGVNGSKVDFCELFPDTYELKFADGTTNGAHHWYPVVFNTLLYNAVAKNPEGGMTINRGGGIGAQRYPWIWMGDQKREFRFIEAQLKAVISCGVSGVPFATYDMAGYKDAADNEDKVFQRAVEFTAFTGNIQTHGTVKRPYDYDETTKAIYRKYAKIHDALRPYLVEQGKIASETGLPLVRHLALNYWSDSKVWDIEDEYMLGNKLLVAPILDSGKTRNIYLPAGTWKNIWTGEIIEGGQTLYAVSVPADEIPVFENTDAQSAAYDQCIHEVIALHAGE